MLFRESDSLAHTCKAKAIASDMPTVGEYVTTCLESHQIAQGKPAGSLHVDRVAGFFYTAPASGSSKEMLVAGV